MESNEKLEWEMEEYECLNILLKRYKRKPAQTTAQLYHLSLTRPKQFKGLFTLLVHWLETSAETDILVQNGTLQFPLLHKIALSCNRTEYRERIRIAHVLYALLNEPSQLDFDETREFLNDLKPTARTVLCQTFLYFHLQMHKQMHEMLITCFSRDFRTEGVNILLSFGEESVKSVKWALIDAREKEVISCTCSTKTFENWAYTKHSHEELEETSFIEDTKSKQTIVELFENNNFNMCTLHETISELDDLVRLFEDTEDTSTKIAMKNISGKRHEVAYHKMMMEKGSYFQVCDLLGAEDLNRVEYIHKICGNKYL